VEVNIDNALEEKSIAVIETCKTVTIQDNAQYDYWLNYGREVKTVAKKIEEFFKPLKTKAKEAHQAIVDAEKAKLKPLNLAESVIKTALLAYDNIRAQRAQDEANRLQAQLKEQAEQQILETAAAREAAGDKDGAEALLNSQVYIPPVSVVAEPKGEGLSYRTDTKFEITDPNLIPREFLMPDEKCIQAQGDKFGTAANVPGVRFYQVKTPVMRRK
jgi:hypothetical protein